MENRPEKSIGYSNVGHASPDQGEINRIIDKAKRDGDDANLALGAYLKTFEQANVRFGEQASEEALDSLNRVASGRKQTIGFGGGESLQRIEARKKMEAANKIAAEFLKKIGR